MYKKTLKKCVFSGTLVFIFVMFLSFSSGLYPPVENIYAYYKLDDTTNATGEDIFNLRPLNNTNYTGTSVTSGVTGIINTGFFFRSHQTNVLNSFMNITNFNRITDDNNFTFTAWVNITGDFSNGVEFPIVSAFKWGLNTDEAVLRIEPNGTFSGLYSSVGNDFIYGTNVSDSTFHFLVFTGNVTSYRIYDNGVEVKNKSRTVAFTSTNHQAVGGYFRGSGIIVGNGTIDEVGLWDRTLTDAEILELYNGGVGLSLDPQFEETSQDFRTSVPETTDTTFEFNFTIDGDLTDTVLVNMTYNNSVIVVNPVVVGDNVSVVTTLQTPEVNVLNSVNFNYTVAIFSGTDSLVFSTALRQQNVTPLDVISIGNNNCSNGFIDTIRFNSTTEANLTIQNTSIEYNIPYGTTNTTSFINVGSFIDVNEFVLCVNGTVDSLRSGLGEIQYGEGNFVERRFYIFEGVSFSNNTQINYTIHNLFSLDATSFLINVENPSLIPFAEHYVSIMRWYPDRDEYRTVEMAKTDENGETVVKVVEEDVDYRLAVHNRTGSLIFLTDPTRMICLEDPCTYDIFISDDIEFEIFSDLDFTLVFNETTSVFTLTWNDPSQNTQTVNLTVYRDGSTGSAVLCSKATSNFVGVMACDVTGTTGRVRAVVTRASSPPIILMTLIQEIRSEITDFDEGNIVLWGAVILGTLGALIGAFMSPLMALVFLIVALIPAWALGGITFTIVSGIIILFIVIGHFIRRAGSDGE